MTPPIGPKFDAPHDFSPFSAEASPSDKISGKAKLPLSRKISSYIYHSGHEIVYGLGDAVWGALTFPDKAFKYWFGVDQKLGQDRAWSFSNLGREWDWSLQGNPIYRVVDTAAHIFYGAINTLTAGIPHQVFNEKLGLNIEYFSPPPQDLRSASRWLTQGFLTLLPLRGPVGKAVARHAESGYAKNSAAQRNHGSPSKIEFLDRSQVAAMRRNPGNLDPAQLLKKDAPNFGHFMKENPALNLGEGLQIVEAKNPAPKIIAEVQKPKVIAEHGFRMSYDPVGELGFRVVEETPPQEYPSGLPKSPIQDPGLDPNFDVMLAPGIDKIPAAIGDPEELDPPILEPNSQIEKLRMAAGMGGHALFQGFRRLFSGEGPSEVSAFEAYELKLKYARLFPTIDGQNYSEEILNLVPGLPILARGIHELFFSNPGGKGQCGKPRTILDLKGLEVGI